MSKHSVAEAKNGLSALIDKAQAGEQIIITRHGHAVAELRPLGSATPGGLRNYAWLKAQREKRQGVNITSVDLLRALYEDED